MYSRDFCLFWINTRQILSACLLHEIETVKMSKDFKRTKQMSLVEGFSRGKKRKIVYDADTAVRENKRKIDNVPSIQVDTVSQIAAGGKEIKKQVNVKLDSCDDDHADAVTFNDAPNGPNSSMHSSAYGFNEQMQDAAVAIEVTEPETVKTATDLSNRTYEYNSSQLNYPNQCRNREQFLAWQKPRTWLGCTSDGKVTCFVCSQSKDQQPFRDKGKHHESAFISDTTANDAKSLLKKIDKHRDCGMHANAIKHAEQAKNKE